MSSDTKDVPGNPPPPYHTCRLCWPRLSREKHQQRQAEVFELSQLEEGRADSTNSAETVAEKDQHPSVTCVPIVGCKEPHETQTSTWVVFFIVVSIVFGGIVAAIVVAVGPYLDPMIDAVLSAS